MAYLPPQLTLDPSNPKNLLKEVPCLDCLSRLELLMIAILGMAEEDGTYTMPDDTNQLIADSACYTCLSDTQLLELITLALSQGLSQLDTVATVRQKLKCLRCANPAQIKGAFTFLILKILQPVQLG